MKKTLCTALLNELSARFGDSFYLLDSDCFEENYRELSETFRRRYPKFNIAYSYKTNYTPKLVQIVDRLGGFAEVVSEMEMEIALRSGVSPARIVWNGPVKDAGKLRELLLAGGQVNVDSLPELEEILRFAEEGERTLNVGLRCNYDVGDGVLSRFGFDTEGEDFGSALCLITQSGHIRLRALQAHFAKRAPEYWTARAGGMLKLYDRVVRDYALKPEILDLGGGIYGKMPASLRKQLGVGEVCYEDYASRAAVLFAERFGDDLDAPTLFIEPGTAVAGDSMRFVTRIETIKTVRGKAIASTRGSQKNISMSGVNPPITVVPGGNARKKYQNIDLTGFTCIEGDVLFKNYCGELAVGDYLVIGNCGSYSLVMKPPFILPNFPVLDISGEGVEVIKRAETFDDLFGTFCFKK